MLSRSAPLVALTILLSTPTVARADFVTDWTQIAVAATAEAEQDAGATARTLALVHLAVHDALALVDHTHALYPESVAVPVEGPISREAAVAAAGHHVLVQLFPAQAVELAAELDAALDAVEAGPARDHGVSLGVDVATLVLAQLLQPGAGVDGGVSDAGPADAGSADAGPVDAGPPPAPPGPKTPGKPVTDVDNGCSLGSAAHRRPASAACWLAILAANALRRRRSSKRAS